MSSSSLVSSPTFSVGAFLKYDEFRVIVPLLLLAVTIEPFLEITYGSGR